MYGIVFIPVLFMVISVDKLWSLSSRISRVNPSDLALDRKIILERILEKSRGKLWAGLICLRIGTSDGLLGSVKGGEFLDWVTINFWRTLLHGASHFAADVYQELSRNFQYSSLFYH
jgi:hypothetical protein